MADLNGAAGPSVAAGEARVDEGEEGGRRYPRLPLVVVLHVAELLGVAGR